MLLASLTATNVVALRKDMEGCVIVIVQASTAGSRINQNFDLMIFYQLGLVSLTIVTGTNVVFISLIGIVLSPVFQ